MYRFALAGILTLAPALAAAQGGPNLVVNPGFEDGTYQYMGPPVNSLMPVGWTLTHDAVADVGTVFPNSRFPGAVHTGGYAFVIGNIQGAWSLSQAIATTPGTAYDFSFWAFSRNVYAGNTSLTFGDVTLSENPRTLGTTYRQFTGTAVATGALTTLSFTGGGDALIFVDDVSVTAAPTAVPEPATWALVGAGLAAVGGVARRRRRA